MHTNYVAFSLAKALWVARRLRLWGARTETRQLGYQGLWLRLWNCRAHACAGLPDEEALMRVAIAAGKEFERRQRKGESP